jgi:hypothetical protein
MLREQEQAAVRWLELQAQWAGQSYRQVAKTTSSGSGTKLLPGSQNYKLRGQDQDVWLPELQAQGVWLSFRHAGSQIYKVRQWKKAYKRYAELTQYAPFINHYYETVP